MVRQNVLISFINNQSHENLVNGTSIHLKTEIFCLGNFYIVANIQHDVTEDNS
jgi:hypothetical protein